MKLIIHRGSQQIGGSCIELASDRSRLILDVGLPLNVDPEALASADGLARYRPRVQGVFNDSPEDRLADAVLLSHCHPDHSKFCSSIHPKVPIHMSAGTKAVMDAIGLFLGIPMMTENVRMIETRPPSRVKIGAFEIEPILVDHSAPDALAFIIRAEGKSLIYTGDFRAHGRKGKLFDALARRCPKNPDVLLMEGTMVGSHRTASLFKSEMEVEAEVVRLTSEVASWPVLANFSPSNLDRLVSFLRACQRTNTALVVDLFTAHLYSEMKRLGWNIPDISEGGIRVLYFRGHAKALEKAGKKDVIYSFARQQIKFSELAGPGRRIILFRPNHLRTYIQKNIAFKGALLVNSQYEGIYPGQEETMRNFEAYLKSNGIKKVQVHTSGHAFEEDLKKFADMLKPGTLIPIHTCHPGEYQNIFDNHHVRQLKDGEEFDF